MILEFTMTDGEYVFTDALILPDDHTLPESDIEAMKQQRFANWLGVLNAPEETVDG